MWSDDTWLQEHAGKTLEKSDEKGTKRPSEDVSTVSSQKNDVALVLGHPS